MFYLPNVIDILYLLCTMYHFPSILIPNVILHPHLNTIEKKFFGKYNLCTTICLVVPPEGPNSCLVRR